MMCILIEDMTSLTLYLPFANFKLPNIEKKLIL